MSNIFYQGPSFEKLHDEYAKNGLIDDKAPVKSSSQIIIKAPTEMVWSIIYNIADWISFNSGFSNIRLRDGVQPDALFSFKLNKMPIKAKFAVVHPNSELSWTGKSLWTKAIDRITLTLKTDDETLVKIEESFSGMFISLFVSEEKLKAQHNRWLCAIKFKAEKEAKR